MLQHQYVRGYEVNGVSPLPHYFEEIYGHIKGIPNIGPRGDNNYFWYSKDGHGGAYYALDEQEKSAKSTYEYLGVEKNRKSYIAGIHSVITRVEKLIDDIETTDIASASTDQLHDYALRGWLLDAEVFSFYLISQPYRLQIFENDVRNELRKRVASSKIDYYLARLTASEELTKTAEEERDWAKLMLEAAKLGVPQNVSVKTLTSEYPKLCQSILVHFDHYKILKLGDGIWELDQQSELSRFINEYKKSPHYYKQRIKDIRNFPRKTLAEREKLTKELYLDKKTIATVEFLTTMGHTRYGVRVEGFIPIIYVMGQVLDELAPRLGYQEGEYGFMTHEEFLISAKQHRLVVPRETLLLRRGKHDEYMIRLENGRVKYYYGEEAGEVFRQLLPPVDYSVTDELTGVAAEEGEVEATVTVFRWGDDMESALKNIRKHPILVAGQTRPAMMPLIREAKGIITDEGGVTSHAAIVARELKIPAVINTHNATNVFKTGDLALLDANKGVVRKLS